MYRRAEKKCAQGYSGSWPSVSPREIVPYSLIPFALPSQNIAVENIGS